MSAKMYGKKFAKKKNHNAHCFLLGVELLAKYAKELV